MENRIKECQGDLFADRTSTATLCANQLRLWLASFAYALLCAVRRIGLAHTQFAEATCGTIRLKLLKLAGLVRVSARRIKFALALSLSLRRRMAAGRRPPRHNRLTRRRDAEKNAAIQPTTHRRPPKDRPHPRKPRQGRARPRHGHCAIIVGSRRPSPSYEKCALARPRERSKNEKARMPPSGQAQSNQTRRLPKPEGRFTR